jgi:hypothetical protein
VGFTGGRDFTFFTADYLMRLLPLGSAGLQQA